MGVEQEKGFILTLEIQMNGYGLEKHKDDMAEQVLRELETKFGYDAFKVYQIVSEFSTGSGSFKTIKKRVYRSDRNATKTVSTDAGVDE